MYSFASGYTHIFSQNMVNYFNPAFSWYSSIFQPTDPAKTLAAFPMVLQGVGSNAPFTPMGIRLQLAAGAARHTLPAQ